MRQNNSSTDTPDSNSTAREKDASTEFRVVDKRHFVNVESTPPDAPVAEKQRYPSFVEELMARVSETERRFEEKRKQVDAEIGKIKSRLEADYERKVQLEKQNLLLPFLEILDNLERAIDAAEKGGGTNSLFEGVSMTANLFRAKLQMHGVEPVKVLHQDFDPNLCQAVGVVEVTDEAKDGVVVEELVRGYRIGDQLLRPAQVRVGKLADTGGQSASSRQVEHGS